MKSGIDVDPMFMRLPNRPPAGAEPKDGTAPAWRREMERAQMEAWLGHSMVGFASPAAAGKKMEALRPPDASSGFDGVVLPTNKTGNTAEQRMQERTHRMAVDRPPLNRAHQVQGSHIESSSQVQVSATSGNRRGGDQASMAARDHTRALRESRDLPPTIDAHARTEQLISLFQSLDAMAATNAEEQHGGIDAASQLLVSATADAPSTSVGSVPAMLTRSTAALTNHPGTLIAAPRSPGNPLNLPTAAMLSGVPSQGAGRNVCVDGADQTSNMAGGRRVATREPIRLHADWSAEGVRLWLGMDASHLGSLEFINAQLQRWLSTQGLKLLSMSVNGRVVEQAHQKNDSDVYEAEIERAAGNVTPDAITPTLKEFPCRSVP
jgi:hypothetical protein